MYIHKITIAISVGGCHFVKSKVIKLIKKFFFNNSGSNLYKRFRTPVAKERTNEKSAQVAVLALCATDQSFYDNNMIISLFCLTSYHHIDSKFVSAQVEISAQRP